MHPQNRPNPGEMAEWSIAAVLKTVVPKGTGGSNPSFSAKQQNGNSAKALFFLFPCPNAKLA